MSTPTSGNAVSTNGHRNSSTSAESAPRRLSRRVAVIGAGASGLVCAREFQREGHVVTIFEQAKEIGGTWNLDPVAALHQTKDVSDTDWKDQSTAVHSSLYDNLRTVVAREVMGYTEFPFDVHFGDSVDPRRFCSRQEVRRYLEAYKNAFNLQTVIEFESKVLSVEPTTRTALKWDVEIEISQGDSQVRSFDAVVVAHGQYTCPYVPKIEGIESFNRPRYHSHLYRNARPFKDMNVAILGSSFSGIDVSQEISHVAKGVYVCGRNWLPGTDFSQPCGVHKNVHFLPSIAHCSGEGELTLTDGRVLKDLDVLLFCTGYDYELQFLEKSGLFKIEHCFVYPLYKHLFHPLQPTLAIVALPDRTLPILMAEYQAKWIARVLSGRCQLPSGAEMMAEVDRSVERHKQQNGALETFHKLPMEQFEYMAEVAALLEDVPPFAQWRADMAVASVLAMAKFPDDFRDREMTDACFDEAYREFAAIRATSAETGSTAPPPGQSKTRSSTPYE